MQPAITAVLLRSQDDARLVGLAAHGSEQAFAVLSQRYRSELIAHARRLVSTDRAEDVVQQGLLSAWAAFRRGAEVREPRAWLHQIVRNEAFRVRASVPQDAELLDTLSGSGDAGEEAALRLDARDALAALAALPDQQRRALELTALDGRSGREAAATLGLGEGALRQLVHRARTSMRAAVGVFVPAPWVDWAASSAGMPATAVPAGAGVALTLGKVGATLAVVAAVAGGGVKILSTAGRAHHQPGAAGSRSYADVDPPVQPSKAALPLPATSHGAPAIGHRAIGLRANRARSVPSIRTPPYRAPTRNRSGDSAMSRNSHGSEPGDSAERDLSVRPTQTGHTSGTQAAPSPDDQPRSSIGAEHVSLENVTHDGGATGTGIVDGSSDGSSSGAWRPSAGSGASNRDDSRSPTSGDD